MGEVSETGTSGPVIISQTKWRNEQTWEREITRVGDIEVILECKCVISGKGAEGAVTHDGQLELGKSEGQEAESMEIWRIWGGNIYRKEAKVKEARAEMGRSKFP
jgi:hypothetical protein